MKLLLLVLFGFTIIFAQTDYKKLHHDALVADMHADALYRYIETGDGFEKLSTKHHLDLVRLKTGGVDIQFFAIWPNPRTNHGTDMYSQSVAIIDTFDNILKRNPAALKLAKSPADIERITTAGKIAACLGLEGGTAIEDNLEKLDYFFNRGVRYLGITWNNSPSWASSAEDETTPGWKGHRGLTEFGKKVIERMNELGMIIDVSHSGEQTFYDILETSKKPIIASHSSVYSICPVYRNLKDAQIKALAAKGGAMFINFNPGFLVKDFDEVYKAAREEADHIQDSLKTSGSSAEFDRSAFIYKKINPVYPDVATVVDHIDYVVKLVGDDYVGIGSDFDGINLTPNGLNDVSKMPNITKELLKRGYSEESIRKILGGNLLRVFKAITE
ncbi:MAG: dipeptidase [Calditrichaeota bacterium]|nr:dipeptidase [Calditrichota bacterium]